MYYNKHGMDDCGRVEGIEDIQKGICKILEGIKCVRDGLEDICKCRLREGINDIKRGLCKIESGLCDIVKGLSDLDDRDCIGRKMIKDGICDIKKGIRDIRDGLNDICRGCICEGVEKIQKGLCKVEEGLCDVIEGIRDVANVREMRRKRVGEMLGGIHCDREDLCGVTSDTGPCCDHHEHDCYDHHDHDCYDHHDHVCYDHR